MNTVRTRRRGAKARPLSSSHRARRGECHFVPVVGVDGCGIYVHHHIEPTKTHTKRCGVIYLDSAATSFPKEHHVVDAMKSYAERGTSPGRSGHRLSAWAEGQVWAARESLADLVKCIDPERVTFSLNATMSLNAVVHHLGSIGGRVLTSAFEHNSVVRPLHAAAQEGSVRHEIIPPSTSGPFDLDRLQEELLAGGVAGVIVTWASNVSGSVLPIREISEICREAGVFIAVDGAQALGYLDVDAGLADVLVFAGHKGLGGPLGVGGAVVGEGVRLSPFVTGGSGGRSESRDHPCWLPWSQEAGTQNGIGIAGLGAALRLLDGAEIARRRRRATDLRERFVTGLSGGGAVTLIESPSAEEPVGVVSFRMNRVTPSVAASLLEERFDILVRAGLHCSPLAHETLGTGDGGTVRVSFGPRTTTNEVDLALAAVQSISSSSSERK
ncbi:cysteine desulfurase [Rathayibacter sp. AY1D4]|nr:cysteine desulfurase [Rathayibacter sp. AY1D4]